MLGGVFIAMAQIIVYAGAVMVLFVFVIMLLNAGIEVRRGRSWMATIFGVPALLGLLGVLACLLARWFPDRRHPVRRFHRRTAPKKSAMRFSPNICCPLKSPPCSS